MNQKNLIVDIGKYYLYRHIRLDKNEIFYIGVGKKVNYRPTSHNEIYRRAYLKAGRNKFWTNIINKTNYEVEIILESDDRDFIFNKENEFIKLYGRKDLKKGTLCNLTDGGEGNLNMPKIKCSEEKKRKISNAKKGIKLTEEHRKALSISHKNNPKVGKHFKNKKLSKEHRLKLSIAKKGKPAKQKSILTIEKLKENYKRNFICIVDGVEVKHYCTLTELKKIYTLSHKSLYKCLSGIPVKNKNIRIYEIN